MQRTGTYRRLIYALIPLILLIFLILFDQITKSYFVVRLADGKVNSVGSEKITVIEGFFYFSYTYNTGAAWSFLANKEWGQIFFKILTVFALIAFFFFYVYVNKKGYKWLKIAMIFIIGGTIGNFIDRLSFNCVADFISFVFGSYHFSIFNMADVYMTVGVIMLIIHYLFLDPNAVFKKNGNSELSDNG